MLCAASISTWALDLSSIKAKNHITYYRTGGSRYVQLEIHECDKWTCTHTLQEIIDAADIQKSDNIDLIEVSMSNTRTHKLIEGIPFLYAHTIDLRNVTNLGSWKNVKNDYVANMIFKYDENLGLLDNSVIENFNPERLYNVISVGGCEPCLKTEIDVYINKPGFLAYGLQYIRELNPQPSDNQTWWNKGTPNGGKGYTYYTQYFTKVRVSGYVFARDIMASYAPTLTEEGHLPPFPQEVTYQNGYSYRPGSRCKNPLAPSYHDKNTIFFDQPGNYGNQVGAMLGSHVNSFDFTNAQFGEWKDENGVKVFKYYPADMTMSMLQELGAGYEYNGRGGSVVELKLPTSPTQYIIPEGFLANSKYIHEICIPSNITEIHGFAFLGLKYDKKTGIGGINHYTTTAAKDGEMLDVLKGQEIDNGPKTMTLPSTLKFVGRGAFSGYGGAALVEDVYVLAEEAPVCEFYAFDQKTYVGEDSHDQVHLIKKGNYVNPNNGMAMLHFPNTIRKDGTLNQKEMMNYSDMTRKYRLYDETGHYDNVGNILVWPTQAQYNRSFNQALAGVTWWAWLENVQDPQNNPTGADNPEWAFSGAKVTQQSWIAGCGDEKANHKAMFTMAAKNDGFSDLFTTSFDDDNPNSSFNPNGAKGHGFSNNDVDMDFWDGALLAKADVGNDDSQRPLSYDFVKYGGWHQFTIAELYDFMLEKPGPNPDKKDYFNFAKYNKNIWYAICFPFNLTKAQLLKAFGNTQTNEYPFLSTLASVVRDSRNANITVVMSKNLLKYNLQYESGKCSNTVKYKNFKPDYTTANYSDDDIVIEANKPYFILPCLPDVELEKAATGQRKSEITIVEQTGKGQVMFPVPTHVHAVKGTYDAYVGGQDEAVSDTAYAYNYYFVGNYIPQTMPENAYYLNEYQKKNGEYWSSFYRNNPAKTGLMWADNDAIVMAKIDDTSYNGSRAKGKLVAKEQHYAGKTHNYIWNVEAHNDWVFFEDTGNEVYAKTAFGMQAEENYTTSIQLPEDFMISEDSKVYNLNGQFVGVDADNMSKGVYIVGGKKIVK